jgi:hypothetical protein
MRSGTAPHTHTPLNEDLVSLVLRLVEVKQHVEAVAWGELEPVPVVTHTHAGHARDAQRDRQAHMHAHTQDTEGQTHTHTHAYAHKQDTHRMTHRGMDRHIHARTHAYMHTHDTQKGARRDRQAHAAPQRTKKQGSRCVSAACVCHWQGWALLLCGASLYVWVVVCVCVFVIVCACVRGVAAMHLQTPSLSQKGVIV